MNKSESIKELATSLVKAQASMSNPKKNASNPFFKSKYADLSEVINVSKQVLAENGLSVVQLPCMVDGVVSVETILIHESGEFLSNIMSMPPVKNDPQGVGSCLTYIRRYSLSAILGIAQEDDDGNDAVKQKASKKRVASVPKEHREMIDKIANALFIANENQDSLAANEVWSELSQQEQTWAWSKIPDDIKENLRLLIEG